MHLPKVEATTEATTDATTQYETSVRYECPSPYPVANAYITTLEPYYIEDVVT